MRAILFGGPLHSLSHPIVSVLNDSWLRCSVHKLAAPLTQRGGMLTSMRDQESGTWNPESGIREAESGIQKL